MTTAVSSVQVHVVVLSEETVGWFSWSLGRNGKEMSLLGEGDGGGGGQGRSGEPQQGPKSRWDETGCEGVSGTRSAFHK